MSAHRVELDVNGKLFYIETGVLAKQASGSVVVGYEETVALAAVSAEESARSPDSDFLPLTVEYRDRTAAAGRIPGGFLKREGRPSDRETLISRLVDRSVRPMFKEGYRNETMIVIHPLSFDFEHETDILALNGASAALLLSETPFHEAVGGVQVGRVEGEFVINPTIAQQAASDMNFIVAGTAESLTMVEGGAREISESDLTAALEYAHGWIKKFVALQKELLAKAGGKEKLQIELKDYSAEISLLAGLADREIRDALLLEGKQARSKKVKETRDATIERLLENEPDPGARRAELKKAWDEYQKKFIRKMILDEGLRVDRRSLSDVRPISIAVDALARAHGSALFTRGETQALVTTTLGSSQEELMVDRLEGRSTKKFMFHYNFPSFCVNEVKRITGPGRREIGHGALAERAIEAVLPDAAEFPYTIRVVSEILESNGSSSMASVCGASLSLMDAGAPIKAAVAGIAMGLAQEGEKVAILSDILGLEDAIGDMDFKVAGSRNGITAAQMDIKLKGGLKMELLRDALEQARAGRLHILDKMDDAIARPRSEISRNAPKIKTVMINPDRVGALIGPGGKVIKGIVAETGCQIDIEDDGSVNIYAKDSESMEKAVDIIGSLTQEAEIGKAYLGVVKRVVDFGAFIEIFPGTEGLCHISELARRRVERVEDEIGVSDEVLVKVINIDPQGKIRLSRKAAMNDDPSADSGDQRRAGERADTPDRGARARDDRRFDRRDDRRDDRRGPGGGARRPMGGGRGGNPRNKSPRGGGRY